MNPWTRIAAVGVLALLMAVFAPVAPAAAIRVVDDSGATIELPRPARRIISLSPHATELLFAAGAGDRLVATVDTSDFPPAARSIERVGNVSSIDLERVVALEPDLVVVWHQGTPARQVAALERLHLPVLRDGPARLDDVAASIERLGLLAGTGEIASRVASDYRRGLAELRGRHADRDRVDTFVQIWDKPLMTVNDRHVISDLLATCGGRNVFGALAPLVPQVDAEAVLAADPEVILTTSGRAGAAQWAAWPSLRAVTRGNIVAADPDLLTRHTPRLLDGARQVCDLLERARERRPRE